VKPTDALIGGIDTSSFDYFDEVIKIVEVYEHPEFNIKLTAKGFDIAILQLEENSKGGLVKLPSEDPAAGSLITSLGWGVTENIIKGDDNSALLYTTLKVGTSPPCPIFPPGIMCDGMCVWGWHRRRRHHGHRLWHPSDRRGGLLVSAESSSSDHAQRLRHLSSNPPDLAATTTEAALQHPQCWAKRGLLR